MIVHMDNRNLFIGLLPALIVLALARSMALGPGLPTDAF